jgi:hypothetical protein
MDLADCGCDGSSAILAGRYTFQNVFDVCQLGPRRLTRRISDEPSSSVRAETGTLRPEELVITAIADIDRCCCVDAQPT